MKRFVLAVALTGWLAFAAGANSVQFQQLRDGVTQFVTPNQNVGCTYIPFDGANGIDTGQNSSELHCYRLTGGGDAVSLGIRGIARQLIVNGVLDCCSGGNVLSYGSAWSSGGYSCKSKATSLSCSFGRHGFVITAKSVKRF